MCELQLAAIDMHEMIRAAERAGFQREGILRNFVTNRDGPADSVVFSLIPADISPG